MADSYLAISQIAGNSPMHERVMSAVTQQVHAGTVPGITDPSGWVTANRYLWAASPSWGEKWDYAKNTHALVPGYDPGSDVTVITDADILSAVRGTRRMTDFPHFAYPFVRGPTGKVGVVEQGTQAHVVSQEYLVVNSPQGYRDDRPEFGWPWPEFSSAPIDLGPLREGLRRWVPDSAANIHEWADEASFATRHIRIEERARVTRMTDQGQVS